MSEPEFYEVKNWKKFQYREASGPLHWIKFYPDILNDPEFDKLSDFNKGTWCLLLLLAARNDGKIPNDPAYLRRRLGFFRAPDMRVFVASGFLISPDFDPSSIQAQYKLNTRSIQAQYKLDTSSLQTHANEIQQAQALTPEKCAVGAPRLDKRRKEKREGGSDDCKCL